MGQVLVVGTQPELRYRNRCQKRTKDVLSFPIKRTFRSVFHYKQKFRKPQNLKKSCAKIGSVLVASHEIFLNLWLV